MKPALFLTHASATSSWTPEHGDQKSGLLHALLPLNSAIHWRIAVAAFGVH
jgi:hypothetical protein